MNISAEDKLILALSRVNLSESAQSEAISSIRKDLDWKYIREATIRHAVAPLFRNGLRQLGLQPPDLPHSEERLFEDIWKRNQSRNERLYGIVGEIIREFNRHNVKTLALKDLQLAKTVYPDAALRPIGDLDLLIRREEYADAARCLGRLGFFPSPHDELPYTLRYAFAHHFRRTADNIWVDVQWDVMQIDWGVPRSANFNFEIERMWGGIRHIAVEGYELPVARPEDLLFHLCMHLEGHRYCELVLLCDIAEFLRYYEGTIDWEYLIAIAQQYEVQSSVYFVLLLASRLLEGPVPGHVMSALQPLYFKSSLITSLFQNLPALHATLDDLHACGAPQRTMRVFEGEARRQAVAAQHVYREIDGLAKDFICRGGTFFMPRTRSSEKVLPSPALEAFNPIEIFIREDEKTIFRDIAVKRGFSGSQAEKQVAINSRADDAAGDFLLKAQIDFVHEDERPQRQRSRKTKAELARRVLAHARQIPESTAVEVDFAVRCLTDQKFVLEFAEDFRRATHDRIFHLCSLDYVSRLSSEPLEAIRGGSHVRLLETARYNEQTARYGGLRSAFYFLFIALSIPDWRGRFRYIRDLILTKSLRSRVFQAAQDAMQHLRKPSLRPAYPFAYWLESASTHPSESTHIREHTYI